MVAAVLFAACIPVEPLPPQASWYCATQAPTTPAQYKASFDGLRTVWTEWAAADGAVPVKLPDGRVLWLFGDTIVGRVKGDRSIADPWSMVHNSAVVQDGACLTPLFGGVRGARSSFVNDPAGNEWYWPSGAVVTDGGTVLRMYLMHVRYDPGPSGFEFRVVGVRVATYSLPSLTMLTAPTNLAVPTTAPGPAYGYTVTLGTDGYVYAYGTTDLGFFLATEHRVARVLPGRETVVPSEWEVYDAVNAVWSTDPTDATPLTFGAAPGDAPKAALAVVPNGTGYLATAKTRDVFSDDVSTWSAPTPVGPWTLVGRAATTGGGDVSGYFTYGGRTVVDLPGGVPTVLWSRNYTPLSWVIADNSRYGPVFASPASGSLPPP